MVHVSPPEQVVEVVWAVGVGGIEASDAVAVVVHEFNNVLVVAEVGVAADAVGGCAVFRDGVFGGDGFGCFGVGDDGGGGGAYGLEDGGLGAVVEGGCDHWGFSFSCWFGCLLERLFLAPVWVDLGVGWFCWLVVWLHGSTFGSTGCL